MTARTWMPAIALAAGIALVPGAAQTGQKTFATPEAAAQALIDAAGANDAQALLRIFGPAGKDIVQSGDAAADKENREKFAALARQKMQVETDSDHDRATLIVGPDEWPFPVPIVADKGAWHFDSAVGRVEVLARRVGRNELAAMDACRAYVEAQTEYASLDRTAGGLLQYAQKIVSSPGKKDGLYWEGESGDLVPKAFGGASAPTSADGQPVPYHGYYFRILKAQGPGRRRGRDGLRGQWQDDRRLRSDRISCRIRRVRHPDL